MGIKVILSISCGLVFIAAFIPYIRAIVREEARPRKATWLVWALGDIIILSGMLTKHTVSGLMVGAVIGATTTFLLSLKYGETGWTTRDKICLTLSGLAILLWLYFGDSNVGIAFSLIALAVAVWPTYVSAWVMPENEDRKAWVLFNVSNVLAIMAIPRLTFADVAPPIVFMAIDVPMLYLLFVHPYVQIDARPKAERMAGR
ncbi:MAG: hypothetical protein Q7S15_00850 [bacterium]|nr:hypothetical protein [bacterium]